MYSLLKAFSSVVWDRFLDKSCAWICLTTFILCILYFTHFLVILFYTILLGTLCLNINERVYYVSLVDAYVLCLVITFFFINLEIY